MTLINNITKIAKSVGAEVASMASSVAKKSSELVEISKLTINVATIEDSKKELLKKIGQIVFDQYETGSEFSQELKDECGRIKEADKKIKSIKERIMEIKNVNRCLDCGTNMKLEDKFCSECGTKLPEIDIVEDDIVEDDIVDNQNAEIHFETHASDSEDDICGPLHCDKQL